MAEFPDSAASDSSPFAVTDASRLFFALVATFLASGSRSSSSSEAVLASLRFVADWAEAVADLWPRDVALVRDAFEPVFDIDALEGPAAIMAIAADVPFPPAASRVAGLADATAVEHSDYATTSPRPGGLSGAPQPSSSRAGEAQKLYTKYRKISSLTLTVTSYSRLSLLENQVGGCWEIAG